MGTGLRGGHRVLIAPPRGPVGRGKQPGFLFTSVSCTCKIEDTPFACSVLGWTGAVIWMADGCGVTTEHGFC